MISLAAAAAVSELNEIVSLDGAELRITDVSPGAIHLELDLSHSSCPECVVPRSLMLDLLTANLAQVEPEIHRIELHDPREDPGYQPGEH